MVMRGERDATVPAPDPLKTEETKDRVDELGYFLQLGDMQGQALKALGVETKHVGLGPMWAATRLASQVALCATGETTAPIAETVVPVIQDFTARETPGLHAWQAALVQVFNLRFWQQTSVPRLKSHRVLVALQGMLGPNYEPPPALVTITEEQSMEAEEYMRGDVFSPTGGKGGRPVTPYEAARRFAAIFGLTLPRSCDARRVGKAAR
jgi:hypothetical protein